MAGNLLNTYVIGFDRAIRETVEVKGGKLRPYVQLATGDLFRKEGVYQRTTGGGLPQKVTNRFGDSPVSDIDYSRRRTSRISYQDGQFMDWADVSKMGVDPRNAKLQVMKNKFMRQEDIILDKALLASAQGGAEGQTPVDLGASNFVEVDVTTSGTAEGFTYKKFLAALELFGSNNVDIDSQAPVFKISWKQWKDMMDDDNFINFDYTSQRPVDQSVGTVYDYMGAKFCISNILPYMDEDKTTAYTAGDINVDDTDINTTTGTWSNTNSVATRSAYAFMPDAALLEVNPDLTTKIAERSDKSFNYYAYMKAEFGAVRMEEEKVVVIPCLES
jgi:hypothetical protein